jgi:Tfp pilus assembly protein PilO
MGFKNFIPIILIVASAGLFFLFIDPTYENTKQLKIDNQEYDEALEKVNQIREIRDGLLSKYQVLSEDDLDRLKKLLPDHIDNVRLILDIDSIAETHGMLAKGIALSKSAANTSSVISKGVSYNNVSVTFNVESTYDEFKRFVKDLNQSLRIIDIVSLSFTPTNISKNKDLYTFRVKLQTYWN